MINYFFDNFNLNFSVIELVVEKEKGYFKSTVLAKVKDSVEVGIYSADLYHEIIDEIYNIDEILINSALQSCVAFSNFNLQKAFNNYDKPLFNDDINKYKINNLIDKFFIYYNDKEFCEALMNHLVDSNTKAIIGRLTQLLDSRLKQDK